MICGMLLTAVPNEMLKVDFEFSDRLKKLPPYLFAKLDETKRKVAGRGVDIIDLGIGDPDIPTPERIVRILQSAAARVENHRYPSYAGLSELRKAIADWYEKRFSVILDPESEVLPLIGSKEGIGHIPLAFINKGDVVLVPDPGYPVYRAGVTLAGGEIHVMPLRQEKSFLPDLNQISESVAKKAKMMFINYPNNPTSAVATEDFFSEALNFARESGIIVCHDAAYSEVCYDGYTAPSFLQLDGAKEVGVEFHSLSKTYNMTGWRIGFVVGSSKVLSGLGKIKTNLDSGIFQAVQQAGIEALKDSREEHQRIAKIYQERRNILVDGLNGLGWAVPKPKATFYVWAPVLPGYDSSSLASALLEKEGVVCTPGVGFGTFGEGFIRMSLTIDKEKLQEAVERIGKAIG